MVKVYLGVHDSEQHRLRNIPVDVQSEYETAGVDEFSAAIDYRAIRDRVPKASQGRRFCLIEALARTILDDYIEADGSGRDCPGRSGSEA